MRIPIPLQGKRAKIQKQFAMNVVDFCKDAMQKNIESGFFMKQIHNSVNNQDKTKSMFNQINQAFSFEINNPIKTLILVGGRMENIKEELKMVGELVEEEKQKLQELFNNLIALDDEIAPMLVNQIRTLRETRMTVEREIKSMLITLQEIREFFLEDEYEKEIKRLREFIGICQELKKLQEDGTLGTISDTIIKLALGGKV